MNCLDVLGAFEKVLFTENLLNDFDDTEHCCKLEYLSNPNKKRICEGNYNEIKHIIQYMF